MDLSTLFSSSTDSSSTDTGGAPSTGDIVGAVTQGMQALSSFFPSGGIKDFLANPIGTITHAITSLAGRTYTTGNYRLGERFMRHILQQDPGSYRKVPDEVVPAAQQFFTMALGVDIWNDEDLQALYGGVEAYFARPDKADVPRPAAVRAVKIMSEWPLYNPQNATVWYVPWPLDVLFKYPADPSSMGYFSTIVNKNMPVPMSSKGGGTNIGSNPTGSSIASPSSMGSSKIWIWLGIGILAIVAIILIIKHSKR